MMNMDNIYIFTGFSKNKITNIIKCKQLSGRLNLTGKASGVYQKKNMSVHLYTNV